MRTKNTLLWITQVLLAALFLFAGATKLMMPIEAMNAQSPLPMPGAFLRFIGVVEILGAVGLILPWLTRIRPLLTPLAAAGLVIVMIGATVLTFVTGGIAAAVMPTVVGLLSGLVAYGRRMGTDREASSSSLSMSDTHRAVEAVSKTESPRRLGEAMDQALDQVIDDDVLRLIFTACHPVLAVEARVALTLRLACGLTTAEIARAFLVPEKTLGQRIFRATRRPWTKRWSAPSMTSTTSWKPRAPGCSSAG